MRYDKGNDHSEEIDIYKVYQLKIFINDYVICAMVLENLKKKLQMIWRFQYPYLVELNCNEGISTVELKQQLKLINEQALMQYQSLRGLKEENVN